MRPLSRPTSKSIDTQRGAKALCPVASAGSCTPLSILPPPNPLIRREVSRQSGLGAQLEVFEPRRQPVAIRSVLIARRKMDALQMQALQRLQGRAIPLAQNATGDMNFEVRIDADQMRIERRVM